MTTFLDRWELRPQERRLVVGFAALLFGLVNLWFVWPRFKDWREIKDKIGRTETTLRRYTNEIGHLPDYQKRLRVLEKQGSIPSEQSIDMMRKVEVLARSKQVEITQRRQPTKSTGPNTNSFFEELSLPLQVATAEPNLVDFLYELGTGDSMIRARDLDLRPGPSGTNLVGSVTLVASYQKTSFSRPALAAGAVTNAVQKVVVNAVSKSPTNLVGKSSTNRLTAPTKPAIKPTTNMTAKVSTNRTLKSSLQTTK